MINQDNNLNIFLKEAAFLDVSCKEKQIAVTYSIDDKNVRQEIMKWLNAF